MPVSDPAVGVSSGSGTSSVGSGSGKKLRSLLIMFGVILLVIAAGQVVLRIWRHGTVVAEAQFDPGIAPFTLTVRRVPVPVTHSDHFIVELRRGEYVVTSFRYFWAEYTPLRVKISWPCIEHFTVTFDESYVATCDWSWGAGATWKMSGPEQHRAGLSPYYFVPRNPIPAGCRTVAPE